MYLRTTQRRRKDGSTTRYVQLAHNRRVNGVTQAEVLVKLGREEDLDLDGLRRLAASIGRFCDGDGAGEALGTPGEFDVVASRPLGGAWLLNGLVVATDPKRTIRPACPVFTDSGGSPGAVRGCSGHGGPP